MQPVDRRSACRPPRTGGSPRRRRNRLTAWAGSSAAVRWARLIRSMDWSPTPLGPIERGRRACAPRSACASPPTFPSRWLGPAARPDLQRRLLADLRRQASRLDGPGLQRVLGLGVAGHRRGVRARPARRDLLPRKPADVPRPQWLPRGDLLHLLVQPHPRRDRRASAAVPPGDRDHRPDAERAAHAGAARSRRARGSGAERRGGVRAHRRDARRLRLRVPFVLFYLVDEDCARRAFACTTGLAPGTAASPLAVDLGAPGDSGWPLSRVLEQRRPEHAGQPDQR